jgi:hypothetical protein
MTQPLSEPYFKRHLPRPNNCSERRTSTSLWMSGPKTSLETQSLYHPHHEGTRTSSWTNARRRDPARRCTPPGHLSLEPAAHPVEGYEHWMRSSTPSVCTTRTCGTPCRTAEISKIPSGTADRSSHCHLPRPEESLTSLGSLNRKGGRGGAFLHVDREVNVIFGGHGEQESRRQQKLNDRQVLVATNSAPGSLPIFGAHNILQPS